MTLHRLTTHIPLTANTRVRSVSPLFQKALLIQSEGKSYYFKIPTQEFQQWLLALRAETFYRSELSMEHFDVVSVLGRGMCGKVTLSRHRETGELVAIKSIHKTKMIQSGLVHIILSERSVLSRIRSPFLIELRFAFQTATKFYLGLEYVPGGDLAGLMHRSGRIPLRDAKIYIAEIGFALSALHDEGIVYRDLKPDNVLIAADGHLKLTDFGFAKEIQCRSTSTFCGTVDYIAPEVILSRPYSYEVDWWALGVLAHELVFGETPFFAENREKMLRRIVNEEPTFPGDADRVVVDFLKKLLIKDGKQRFSFERLKGHEFFDGVQLDEIREKRVAPSFVPNPAAARRAMYVDEEFAMELPIDSLASLPDREDPFVGFEFVNNMPS